MTDPVYRIAYDCTLCRPGCVLLQATIASIPSEVFHTYFGGLTEYWLLAPTKDLKVYDVTEEQLPVLVTRTVKRNPPKSFKR